MATEEPTERTRSPLLLADEAGQTIVEYALIVTTISIGAIAALAIMTNHIGSVFQTLGNAL